MHNPHQEFVNTYRQRLQSIHSIVENDLLLLNEAQLNWKPNVSSWSVAECLQHWLLATNAYLVKLKPVITQAKRNNIVTKEKYHITFSGRLMVFAVDPSIKIPMPSPPSFKPKSKTSYPLNIIKQFQEVLQTLATMIDDSQYLDWNNIKIVSPVTSLMKLNVGDVYETLTLHALRHLKQAKRVMNMPQFPQ